MALIGLTANIALFILFCQYCDVHYMVSQVIATSGVLMINSIVNKNWTVSDYGVDYER